MAYRGKSLRALRESKQIRLQRIANETRISLTYLEDLEEERFDRFPGEFYFVSFVKAYARGLDLDPNEVVTDMQEGFEQWRGSTDQPVPEFRPSVDDGILNRIAGFFRGAQEV